MYVTYTPDQTDRSLQRYFQIQISRAVSQKDEFWHYDFYTTQASPKTIKDLNAGWWYQARMRRCETDKAEKCGDWSTIVTTHFPTIVKTTCQPALALGASSAIDLTPDDPSTYVKYPKLDSDWNEVVIKYEGAIGEGLSPENAFARATRTWGGELYGHIISEPDAKFPEHRVHGGIAFAHPEDFDEAKSIQLLKDFLVAQGITANVRDVFGDFFYYPGGGLHPGIINMKIPFTLLGPLSELPEVGGVELDWSPWLDIYSYSSSQLHENLRDDAQVSNSDPKNDAAQWHGADVWHKAGYTGKGVKIGLSS